MRHMHTCTRTGVPLGTPAHTLSQLSPSSLSLSLSLSLSHTHTHTQTRRQTEGGDEEGERSRTKREKREIGGTETGEETREGRAYPTGKILLLRGPQPRRECTYPDRPIVLLVLLMSCCCPHRGMYKGQASDTQDATCYSPSCFGAYRGPIDSQCNKCNLDTRLRAPHKSQAKMPNAP
jgi:hypothetical protein